MCWGVKLSTHLVVVMGTQYYDGLENAQANYPITDLLQMAGNVSHVDNCGKFVILCHAPREEYYKTFLCGSFPIESVIQHFLHDSLLGQLEPHRTYYKANAIVDCLGNTFMYKRMKNCQGVSYTDMSVHLSELGNDMVTDLQAKNCVGGIDKFFTTELGKMASKFCISYKTMASFSASLTPATTNFKDLLNILSNASEYDVLPIRLGIEEEKEICWLLNNQRFSYENSIVRDPHVIANALIQAHLSRKSISQNLVLGQRYVLSFAVKLLQAIIAITSKKNWSKPTFLAISFNQLLIQAVWEYESDVLLQVPHLTKELVLKCGEKDIKYFDDFVDMEHSERREMLNMSDSKLLDID